MRASSHKILCIAIQFTLLSFTVAAQNPPNQNGDQNFAEHRQKALSDIDQHIQMMQTLKSCVSGASSHDGLKQCKNSHDEQMKNVREQRKQQRKQELDQKIQQLQQERDSVSSDQKANN